MTWQWSRKRKDLSSSRKRLAAKGWSNPLRILELYKDNTKLITDREVLEHEMSLVCEKEEIIFGQKEQLTAGLVEKKSRGDLIVENQRMHDKL